MLGMMHRSSSASVLGITPDAQYLYSSDDDDDDVTDVAAGADLFGYEPYNVSVGSGPSGGKALLGTGSVPHAVACCLSVCGVRVVPESLGARGAG